jgi:hypothetical protein
VQLKPGSQLRSQVCDTQVIVVHAANEDLDLTCGGKPMVDMNAAIGAAGGPAPGFDTGAQLGKRYRAADTSGLELLVVRSGVGTLAANDIPLIVKDSKALPASD